MVRQALDWNLFGCRKSGSSKNKDIVEQRLLLQRTAGKDYREIKSQAKNCVRWRFEARVILCHQIQILRLQPFSSTYGIGFNVLS